MTEEVLEFDKKIERSLKDKLTERIGVNIKLTCRQSNNMKTLLNIYGGKLKKITAIVKEDLVGSVTVKIVRGRMELDSVEELKKFMEMVESADYTNIFDNMRKSLHGFLDRCKGDVNVQLKYEVDDVLTQYRKEYQSTLNIKIREFILKEIKSTCRTVNIAKFLLFLMIWLNI